MASDIDIAQLAADAAASKTIRGEFVDLHDRQLLARAYLDLVRLIDAERGYGHDTSPAEAVRYLGNLYRDLLHGAYACAQSDLEAAYADLATANDGLRHGERVCAELVAERDTARAELARITDERNAYRSALTEARNELDDARAEAERLRGECEAMRDEAAVQRERAEIAERRIETDAAEHLKLARLYTECELALHEVVPEGGDASHFRNAITTVVVEVKRLRRLAWDAAKAESAAIARAERAEGLLALAHRAIGGCITTPPCGSCTWCDIDAALDGGGK